MLEETVWTPGMNISERGGGKVRFNYVRQTKLVVSLKQLVFYAEALFVKGLHGFGSETGHGAEEGQGYKAEQ